MPRPKQLEAPHGAVCGAGLQHSRKGKTCTHPAGYRTEHFGTGRCWLHGGIVGAIIKKTSYDVLMERAVEYADDPNVFDLRMQIGTLRAMMDSALEQYAQTGNLEALHAVRQTIDSSVKAVESFFAMCYHKNFAITVAQLDVVLRQIVEIITTEIADPAVREKIAERLVHELVVPTAPPPKMPVGEKRPPRVVTHEPLAAVIDATPVSVDDADED